MTISEGHGAFMTSRISHTSVDCRNAYELSEWWKDLLGYEDIPGDPNEPGHEECMIRAGERGHHLLFIEVPEHKTIKNRIHFDLRPTDRTQDEEYERLLGLGATLVTDHRGKYGPGTGWYLMGDPEGNEFCILLSDAEYAARA